MPALSPFSLPTLHPYFWPSADLTLLPLPGCVTLGSNVVSLCPCFLPGQMGVVTAFAFLRAMT